MATRTLIPVFFPTRQLPLANYTTLLAAGDVANGNQTPNDGGTICILQNTDGANPHTLTLQLPSGVDGEPITSRTWTVPASTSQITGVLPINFYSNTLIYNVDNAQLKVLWISLL